MGLIEKAKKRFELKLNLQKFNEKNPEIYFFLPKVLFFRGFHTGFLKRVLKKFFERGGGGHSPPPPPLYFDEWYSAQDNNGLAPASFQNMHFNQDPEYSLVIHVQFLIANTSII